VSIRITGFSGEVFDCLDPALQDQDSETYARLTIVFCAGVVDSVNGVVSCTSFTISCGSVVVQANVNVEAEIDQQITKTEDKQAPVTQQKFMEQLAQNIQNNQNFTAPVQDLVVADINECGDPDMNDCSPNAECINTEGAYTCKCLPNYPVDISRYTNVPGRVCAKPCGDLQCNNVGESCKPQAESDPKCVCPAGVDCFPDRCLTGDCSPNAVCTNYPDRYNCTCTEDYSHDMSDDPANKPGRVCAGSCDKLACTDKKVCQEVAESDPECVCPSGTICGAYIFGIIGSILFILLVIIMVAIVVVCKRSGAARDKLLPQYFTSHLRVPGVFLDPQVSGKPVRPADSRYRPRPEYRAPAQEYRAPATVFQAPPPGVAVRRGYQ